MQSITIQKEDNEEFERILHDSLTKGSNSISPKDMPRYLAIMESQDQYPLKHSRWNIGVCQFSCNSKCMPRLENEVLMSAESSKRLGCFSKEKVYMDLEGFEDLCFPRCGSCNKYPNVDPKGSIDVRLFGENFGEFKKYYLLRPEHLLKRDIDVHPESVDIHRFMLLKVFEKEPEICKKILSVL